MEKGVVKLQEQRRGFRLLEELIPQLSFELGPRHLGDHLRGVRDLGYTRPRDPM
jgi:hypothetical protein